MSPILSARGGLSSRAYGQFAASTAVAPDLGAMFPLGMVQVGSAGASSISFTSIPNTYKHLQVRFISINNAAQSIIMRFNNDTSSVYAKHALWAYGNGTDYSAGYTGGYFNLQGYTTASSSPYPTAGIVDVLDYANTNKYKTARILSGFDSNGGGEIDFNSGLWQSSSAISSIQIALESGGTINQYSQFALYGIKGA
jgi:hypothetical protein